MRQISRQSGLALGSIYNHFSSKDEIFLAMIQSRHPMVSLLPKFAAIQATTIQEFVRVCAREMIFELDQRPELINLFLIEMIEFKGQHATALLQQLHPDIHALNLRLQGYSHQLRPLPPSQLVRVLLGMMVSFALTEKFLKNGTQPELAGNTLESLIEIFLNGIVEPSNKMALERL